MTAALAMPNANPFGADNMFGYMNDKQIGLAERCWPSSSSTAIWARSARIASTIRQPAGRASCGSHMRLLAIALGDRRHHRRRRQRLGLLHPVAVAARHPGAADRRDHPGRSIPAAGRMRRCEREWRAGAFIAWAAGSVVAFFVSEHMRRNTRRRSAAFWLPASSMACCKVVSAAHSTAVTPRIAGRSHARPTATSA